MSARPPGPAFASGEPPDSAPAASALTAGGGLRGRLGLYLRLGRVSNLPTVWSNCLAGLVLAGAGPGLLPGVPLPGVLLPAILLMAALTLFYTGGMFLNDAFDADFDREHRPERPIPLGLLPLQEVYALGFLQLVLGGLALALPAWAAGEVPRAGALLGGGLLAGAIVYYDWRHKRDPLSPVVMALTRGLVYFIAAATVAPAAWPLRGSVWLGMLVLMGYLIGLTYAAKQEHLLHFRNGWPLVLLVAPLVYTLPLLASGVMAAAVYLFFAAWLVFAVSLLLRKSRRNVPRAVVSLIAGISLLDAALILQADVASPWAWFALGAFALTLLLQRYIAGT